MEVTNASAYQVVVKGTKAVIKSCSKLVFKTLNINQKDTDSQNIVPCPKQIDARTNVSVQVQILHQILTVTSVTRK